MFFKGQKNNINGKAKVFRFVKDKANHQTWKGQSKAVKDQNKALKNLDKYFTTMK